MSPIIPSRFGHPKYNIFPQKSRAASLGGVKQNQRGTPGQDSKSRRKQRVEESKITVQPTEDEDGDNFYSKHLAAARFQRNHRLINVLFSEVVVDTEQQPSDTEKLNGCKKRVKSLIDYQKKIDDEINEMNEKFNAKKLKIVEDSKKFVAVLDDYITKSKKEIAALKATQEIRRQQEATLKQQAKPDSTTNAKGAPLSKESKGSKVDSTQNGHVSNGTIPMEVTTEQELSHTYDVRLVLEKIINSVADSI